MTRPATAEWEVLDLSEDPTPGDPEILRKLAAEYDAIADDAESTFTFVSQVNDGQLGEGKSMEKLREVLDELPKQVGQLRDSYRRAAEALTAYIPKLEAHQDQAARALQQGREAKSRLDLALAAVESAGANLSSLEAAQPPDDEQSRNAARDAIAGARSAKSSAQGDVDLAQSDLSVAKRLAADARDLRESDARLAATELDTAKDDAVKKKSFWDGIWDEILGLVIGIVAVVVAVVCLVVPGLQGVGIAVGLALGVAGLGLSIGKGIATGEWDIAGIVFGVLGLGLGGVAAWSKIVSSGGIANVLKNLGQSGKNFFRPPGTSGAGGGGGGNNIPLQNLPTRPPATSTTPPGSRPPSVGDPSTTPPGSPPPTRPPSSSDSFVTAPESTPAPTPPPTRPPSVGDPSTTPPGSPPPIRPPSTTPTNGSTASGGTVFFDAVEWTKLQLAAIWSDRAGVAVGIGIGIGYSGWQLSEAIKTLNQRGEDEQENPPQAAPQPA